MELLDLSLGLVQLGVRELNIVIPYFGYSTMERSIKHGELVKAKIRADLFSALIPSNAIIRIYLFDLHSEGIPYYFPTPIFTTHVYCKKLISSICKNISNDFVLAATDSGRAKWVESLAKEMNVQAAYVYKNRIDATHTEVSGINADVKGKTVIIYDDMIRSGSTLLEAAASYHQAGATALYAVCTHAVFCEDTPVRLQAQNLIKKIFCTNSNPLSIVHSSDYIEKYSLAGIIFEAIAE
jgi:ribose-phosphate pyrophosphokinase